MFFTSFIILVTSFITSLLFLVTRWTFSPTLLTPNFSKSIPFTYLFIIIVVFLLMANKDMHLLSNSVVTIYWEKPQQNCQESRRKEFIVHIFATQSLKKLSFFFGMEHYNCCFNKTLNMSSLLREDWQFVYQCQIIIRTKIKSKQTPLYVLLVIHQIIVDSQ